MGRRTIRAMVLVTLGQLLGTPALAEDDDLYRALGEQPGIDALVEQFLLGIADDERINHFFIESDIQRFQSMLQEHLCMLVGGGCAYSGDNMKRTHAGMAIDYADFNAVVEIFIEAMEALDISTGVQNRLLKRMAPLHADIVEDTL